MKTQAEPLMQHGCLLAAQTWDELEQTLNWNAASVDRIFSHQVGSAHRKLLLETLGIDPAKDHVTYPWLGNTGSAALPVTLAHGIDEGLLERGDSVALLGIGSGINCLMLGVEW